MRDLIQEMQVEAALDAQLEAIAPGEAGRAWREQVKERALVNTFKDTQTCLLIMQEDLRVRAEA